MASVNREANDDHFRSIIRPLIKNQISRAILYRYHPKLYHRTVTGVVSLLGIDAPDKQLLAAQAVSAAAGIAAMAVLGAFLFWLPLPRAIGFAVYAWFALNPGLVAICGQATNDTFVLLFSLGATLCLWRWLAAPSRPWLAALLVCLALAIGSKGNGLVLGGAVFLILAGKRRFGEAALALIVTLVSAQISGVYGENVTYQKLFSSDGVTTGNPFGKSSQEAVPMTSETGRAVLARGFLTLPIADLILHPRNDFPSDWNEYIAGKGGYPHMKSYWTQVYGNATYSRFHDWPPSWRTRAPGSLPLARALHLLNLLPLVLFFLGMALLIREKIQWPAAVLLGAFFLAGMRYYMLYPIFPFAKFIYVAPAAGAAAIALERGIRFAKERLSKKALGALVAIAFLLACLDVIDVVWLTFDLAGTS